MIAGPIAGGEKSADGGRPYGKRAVLTPALARLCRRSLERGAASRQKERKTGHGVSEFDSEVVCIGVRRRKQTVARIDPVNNALRI